jgi:glycosyltransferase involved in cell wall biosynthesis
MKIALIGPGIMSIPPPGWGAVEILIWDYFLELKKQGQNVDIINIIRNNVIEQSNPNTEYCQYLINIINDGRYDFVHIHYDMLYHIMPFLTCKKIGITSHYPYINQLHKHLTDGFTTVFSSLCENKKHTIFALAKKDYETFENLSSVKSNIFYLLNGANHNEIMPVKDIDDKEFKYKSIYVGKIEERKQQYKYCSMPNIDFYGKCDNVHFRSLLNFKGELPHNEIVKKITQYGNLILLSTGEADPLVIKEALMAGLPVVTNKHSTNDMYNGLPFIDIIPDDKLDDLNYVHYIIQENLKKQVLKDEIRAYAMEHFSWEKLVQEYITNISSISENE